MGFSAWWQQYKKEVLGFRGEVTLIAAAIVVWTLFLLSRIGSWVPELIFTLYWLPVSFLPIWAIWTAVQLYRQEWRENTSYLMLSLPVRAWTITSAKLAVLLTGIIGFSLFIFLGAWLLAVRTGLMNRLAEVDLFQLIPMDWFVTTSLLGYFSMVAGVLVIGLIAQVAFVVSRLFSRFRWLAEGWTWFLSFWLMGRFGDLGGRFLGWLPDFHLRVFHTVSGDPDFHTVAIQSGPFWGLVLFAIVLYIVLNVTIERAIEV